jgi:hypothetical protein
MHKIEVFLCSVLQAESIFTPGSHMSFVVDKLELGMNFSPCTSVFTILSVVYSFANCLI